MEKTSEAEKIRERDRSVLAAIKKGGKQPLRKLAEVCKLSKDKVYRALKARKRRHEYKEAELWESELAQQWLHRMFFTLLVTFVLEGGVGAERVSTFLHRVRLEKETCAELVEASVLHRQPYVRALASLKTCCRNTPRPRSRRKKVK